MSKAELRLFLNECYKHRRLHVITLDAKNTIKRELARAKKNGMYPEFTQVVAGGGQSLMGEPLKVQVTAPAEKIAIFGLRLKYIVKIG